MNVLPFAPSVLSTFWADLIQFPLMFLSAAGFVFVLHRLGKHFQSYGLPRNLLFGAASGAVAFVLVQLYALSGRRSLVLGEVLTGFVVAVVLTVIWRLVFAQRPPRPNFSGRNG